METRIIIKRFSPDQIHAWLDFFDKRAFCDNPSLQSCYCTYFHKPKIAIADKKPPKANRDYAISLLKAGLLCGYLAYNEAGLAIAWCSAAEKSTYLRKPVATESNAGILSIMCFVISADYRGQRLSFSFVEHIIADARLGGFINIEAYPRKNARTAAGAFHGGYSMYEHLGFKEYTFGAKSCLRLQL